MLPIFWNKIMNFFNEGPTFTPEWQKYLLFVKKYGEWENLGLLILINLHYIFL